MDNYNDFSYWFSDTIVDPNGKTVCDINKGIKRTFTDLVTQLNNTVDNKNSQFVINEHMQGQPDAVASIKYGYDGLWWFVALSNNLENPIEDFIDDKVFYIFEQDLLTNYVNQEEEKAVLNNTESKIGKIIELN